MKRFWVLEHSAERGDRQYSTTGKPSQLIKNNNGEFLGITNPLNTYKRKVTQNDVNRVNVNGYQYGDGLPGTRVGASSNKLFSKKRNMMTLPYLFFLLSLVNQPVEQSKCGCTETVTLKQSKVVFEGRVLSVKESPEYGFEIKFEVLRKRKGTIKGHTSTTYTPCLDEGCCGIAFEEGATYLVVTRRKFGKLYSDRCTLTQKLFPKGKN